MSTANKSELAKCIVQHYHCTKKEAEKAIDMCCGGITKCLTKCDKVSLIGFGTFSKQKRSARTGRNPRTGAKINIPACVVPKFKAGQNLKKACK